MNESEVMCRKILFWSKKLHFSGCFFSYFNLKIRQMKSITLVPYRHRKELMILIKFAYDPEIKERVKQFEQVKWSSTHGCYYVLFTAEIKNKLFLHLSSRGWFIDYSQLSCISAPEEKVAEKVIFNGDQENWSTKVRVLNDIFLG